MKNIYTWAANPAKRTVTVGDIIEAKGKKILTQVTANNSLEAKAAEEAGFDMIIGSASNVKKFGKDPSLFFIRQHSSYIIILQPRMCYVEPLKL